MDPGHTFPVSKKLGNSIFQFQSTLGFTTRGSAVDLALATGRAVTDLRQYINSDLVFSDLKFGPLCSEIATVKVVIPNGLKPILLLATTWSLYQAEIHLI